MAILIFTKGGETDGVWFYDLVNDGFSLEDKRNPIGKNDLSINRYKEVVYQEEQYEPPKEILARLKALEVEIQQERVELEGML